MQNEIKIVLPFLLVQQINPNFLVLLITHWPSTAVSLDTESSILSRSAPFPCFTLMWNWRCLCVASIWLNVPHRISSVDSLWCATSVLFFRASRMFLVSRGVRWSFEKFTRASTCWKTYERNDGLKWWYNYCYCKNYVCLFIAWLDSGSGNRIKPRLEPWQCPRLRCLETSECILLCFSSSRCENGSAGFSVAIYNVGTSVMVWHELL